MNIECTSGGKVRSLRLSISLIRLSCLDLANASHHTLDVTSGVNVISMESNVS